MENRINKGNKGLKLKTRLIITFCFVVIMPSAVLSLCVSIFFHLKTMTSTNLVLTDEQARSLIFNSIVVIVVSMSIVAFILIISSYKGMVDPIIKLTEAAKRMSCGDLDFSIETTVQTKEIDSLYAHFEEMRRWIKQYIEEKNHNEEEQRKLITNIGHDLKTPVTAIKGYAEGILDGVADTPEKREKYIQTILAKANELDSLISELTYYSRIENEKIPYFFRQIDVTSYFNDCIEEVQMDLEDKNFVLNYSNELSEPTTVIADPIQMKKVINNLVGNAIKYNDKKQGVLGIRIRDNDEFVIIEISDNGKGISAKDIPFIFDRFFRADSSRSSATGGSGIGLSIVHKIVEDHGGRIWANSQEKKGTTMFIELRKYKERRNDNE